MKSENNKITPLQGIKKEQKKMVLEELKKTPIIQFVCQKYNVPRSTFYRWMRNEKFKKDVKGALTNGYDVINDLAISQLINKIKNGDSSMIKYWLMCKHPDFMDDRHVSRVIIERRENPMTPERAEQIRKAIEKWKKDTTEDKDALASK